MKILIAADMEGVTGVVHWDHVKSDHSEYPRYRRLMTGDVNAAIRGAFEGGAGEVIVTDGHDAGHNLLIEELDPRARLNAGDPAPLSMVEGLESGINAAMFIGYHARAGAPQAILSHTWSGLVVRVWLNSVEVGEIGLNAAVCGHFEVPVIMISGDQTACAEASELLGPVETAVVKTAKSRLAAECLSPEAAQGVIYTAAAGAVRRLSAGEEATPPFRPEAPITLALQFRQPEMADRVALLPDVRRSGDSQVEYTAGDMPTAYRLFGAAVSLAGG